MLDILTDKCTGRGICDEECPQFVIKIDSGKAKVREQVQCYSYWPRLPIMFKYHVGEIFS